MPPAVALPTPTDDIAAAMLETLQTRDFPVESALRQVRQQIGNAGSAPKTPVGVGQIPAGRSCSGCADQQLDRTIQRNGDRRQPLADEELDFVPRQRLGLDDHVVQRR